MSYRAECTKQEVMTQEEEGPNFYLNILYKEKLSLFDTSLICSQRCLSDPLSPILENSTLSNFQQVDGYVAGKIVIKLLNLERVLYIH